MIAAARLGIVVPGDPNGSTTPEAHNFGRESDLMRSPFTSWSERKSVAQAHANIHPGGVVLRLSSLPSRGNGWSWELSPDEQWEDEVLLRGLRMDAEVLR
jgi:hypothetical protein